MSGQEEEGRVKEQVTLQEGEEEGTPQRPSGLEPLGFQP